MPSSVRFPAANVPVSSPDVRDPSSTAEILSAIIQAIYAVRPFPGPPGCLNPPAVRPATRQAETSKQAAILDGALDKWYFDLPEHLRYDPAVNIDRDASSSLPPPHILTLHMQYWCAVLLLHRPL